MKKILGFMCIAFVILSSQLMIANASNELQLTNAQAQSAGYIYTNVHGSITITDYVGGEKNITIPSSIGGGIVQTIGEKAFQYKELTAVTIPNTVTFIHEYAFADNNLTSIVIPDSVKDTKSCAFSDNKLTSIKLSAGTSYVSAFTFAGNLMTELTIPNNITYIGESAFNSNKLTKLTLSNGVEEIGEFAFHNNLLTRIDIPNSVKSIRKLSFSENLLTTINIPNSVTFIEGSSFNNNKMSNDKAFIYARNENGLEDKTKLVSYAGERKKNVIIPDGIVKIDELAFYNTDLKSVTISDDVTSIGRRSFSYNNELTEVIIPSSVTSITNDAFEGTYNTTIYIRKAENSIFGAPWMGNNTTIIWD